MKFEELDPSTYLAIILKTLLGYKLIDYIIVGTKVKVKVEGKLDFSRPQRLFSGKL